MQKKKKPVQSTQKLIPIREISDGLITTNDNRIIKLMEIQPANFLMKSPSEQNAVAKAFHDLFKAGPKTMQMKVISRPANMKGHLSVLKDEMLDETDPNCLRMQKEYALLLRKASSDGGISRRFFLAFEYEHDEGMLHKPTKGEIKGQMDTVSARLESSFVDCGNAVIDNADSDESVCEMLFYMLNKKKSETAAFSEIKKRIDAKYAGFLGNENAYIPATEYFSPSRIDFLSKDYMIIDGVYYTYAYITANGYNQMVTTGWISPILNACEGIDTDLFFTRVPKEQVIWKIRQAINQSRASLTDTSDTQSSYEDLVAMANAGSYLKTGLASGEDFYYMNIFITISGSSREEINWKFNELKKMLSTMDIGIRRCRHEMEAAFTSTLPLCKLDGTLNDKSKRNCLTQGASSTYPFTAFELSNPNGIFLGRNMQNASLAVLDIFDTSIYKNANMFIAGTTGAGKTFSLLLLAMRMRLKHIPVIIIAPEKEHEFERVAAAMGGQFIRFSSGSPHRINIMDIVQTDDTVKKILDGDMIISSRLSEKVQDLKTFFKLLIPDISYEEKELLDEALMEAYKRKGITEDNESLYDPEDRKKFRQMPVLGDLHSVLTGIKGAERIATIIKQLVTGSGKNFNGHTNVNLDNNFVVLGLEHLSDDFLPIGMYMAIDYAWARIKEDRTRKKALFIDEWWRFAFDPLAADYSLKIAKTIRAYGGSLILATQQMTDIFAIEGGKYGEGVLNNCKIKIIMQLEEHDAEGVQKIMHLTGAEKARITRFRQGEALLVANSNSVAIRFESNRTEFNLITTDRKSLEEQALMKMTDKEREKYLNRYRKKVQKIIDGGRLEQVLLDDFETETVLKATENTENENGTEEKEDMETMLLDFDEEEKEDESVYAYLDFEPYKGGG